MRPALAAVALLFLPASAHAALSSGSHQAARCATFKVSAKSYGVYIADGKVTCGAAEAILRAIDGGKGEKVDHGSSATSYVLYRGWLCPYGNQGEQTCEHSTHPVSNPSQDIASLLCSFGAGCPRRAAFANE